MYFHLDLQDALGSHTCAGITIDKVGQLLENWPRSQTPSQIVSNSLILSVKWCERGSQVTERESLGTWKPLVVRR